MTFTKRLRAWFGWRGRLRRRTWLGMSLLAGTLFVLLFVFLEDALGRDSTWVLYPPLFACQLALAARRLHDQARGAGWMLVVLVPVLGPLLLLAWLLLRGGTRGENQYGPDPRTVGRDYLVVNAYEPG
jgi:uncharacterized membrane protein YhaH (DUF805 family)